MNGLLFLTSEDFTIRKGLKGDIMCHDAPGFMLVLFYAPTCEHCKNIIPIFKSLTGSVMGCQFGMINVQRSRECVTMSKNTIAPITYVPLVILYIDGKPFMVYDGEYKQDSIKRFILDVANNIQKKQQFSKDKVVQKNDDIPMYTCGKPVCGNDKVCYLNYKDAYNNIN